ncbi:hypothetical protein CTAM01_06859 [Colletotrichum tamarilloi]|uniref:Uncharacterized protein n=1 Tax=Colletotrichum tamarilloi TaxID=1209934 RepID=A0ABQ9RAI1_9PEZI|nr:uncharacterized protein CTAM01_06859 [Colletotrichum tamarilloi]KAK1499665.1 hypothetical protein CTAM01_06859 [Colletotrichum tamarilloi]
MEFVVYEDQVMSQDGMGGYSISEHRVDGPGDGMSLSRVFRDDGTVQSGMAVPACLQGKARAAVKLLCRRSCQELSRPLLPFGNPECACDSDMVTSDDDWWIEDGKE